MQWVGLDIGSLTVKIVVLDKGGALVFTKVVPSGRSGIQAAKALLDEVPTSRRFVVVTGYGRVCMEGADLEVSEITCHARGAAHLYGDVGTVIDIGGQDSKVIRLGKAGTASDFVMNDRCAAGTGRFLEVMARSLEVPLTRLGDLSQRAGRAAAISSMCTVFAESEVVSLVAEGVAVAEIVAGLHAAVAERICGMVLRVGLAPPVAMTGGVAHNRGVVRALERRLGCEVLVPPEPHLVGALGAALIAADLALARR
jgi:predicted CoA-substrate-specific enzyme activase